MLLCMSFLSKAQHEGAAREPAAIREVQCAVSPIGISHGKISEDLPIVLGKWRGLIAHSFLDDEKLLSGNLGVVKKVEELGLMVTGKKEKEMSWGPR